MEDARVHCVVLKVRAVPTPTTGTPAQEKAHEEQPPTTSPKTRNQRPAPQDPTACMYQKLRPEPFQWKTTY